MGTILKLLKILVLMVVLAGPIGAGAGVWWWDHAPAGWPNYKVKVFLWTVTLHAPGVGAVSIANEHAAEANAAYASEQTAFGKLRTAFAVENGAVLNLKRVGDNMQARAQAAVAKATTDNAWRLALANRIMASPSDPNADELTACRQADAILLEGAQ